MRLRPALLAPIAPIDDAVVAFVPEPDSAALGIVAVLGCHLLQRRPRRPALRKDAS